jgi:hypothetical protein
MPSARTVTAIEPTLWYHRRWGLWAIGVSVAGITLLAGYVIQYGGGGAWGALISVFGVTVLSWAVPTAIARDARPPRPARAWSNENVWWGGGAWRTRGRGYQWEYEPSRKEWRRREKIPLMGDTRSARWALTQHELLREQNRLLEDQNRLLAGLPPLPREEVPSVIGGTPSGGKRANEPRPRGNA